MMRKTIALLLALILLSSLAGCGLKQKVEEKAAEALAENLMEQGGAEVDIDGDKMTVEGENGEKLSLGGTDWPTSDLAKKLPEYKGAISSVVESTDYLMVMAEEVSQSDAEDYIDKVKKDFTQDPVNMTSEDYVMYSGANADGVTVSVSYTEQSLTISASISQ